VIYHQFPELIANFTPRSQKSSVRDLGSHTTPALCIIYQPTIFALTPPKLPSLHDRHKHTNR